MARQLGNEYVPFVSRRLVRIAALTAVTMLASVSIPAAEQHTTIVIGSNGVGRVSFTRVDTRTSFEREARLWERFQANDDDDATRVAPPANPPIAADPPKPPDAPANPDETLARSIRKMLEARAEQAGQEFSETIQTLKITSNQVHLVTGQTFTNMEELVPVFPGLLRRGGLLVDNVRFETPDTDRLIVTLTPSTEFQAYGKRMAQSWKTAGMIIGVRIELPGNIVSSPLPETHGLSTGFTYNPLQSNAVEVLLKVHQSAVVITANASGLKLVQPLEAGALQRASRPDKTAAQQLPVTDASSGFSAEALGVSTTILHQFPGVPQRSNPMSSALRPATGAMVRARVFPPAGRSIQSIGNVRVLKATDDRGRPINAATTGVRGTRGEAETASDEDTMEFRGNANQAGREIALKLDLPEPDAQSIEELTAEAIVVSTGRWKEQILTNISESATNEIDLAAVLPGAKLTVTKVTRRDRQTSVVARLIGPLAVRDLKVEIAESTPGENTQSNDRSFTTKGDSATRIVQIDQYDYRNSARASPDKSSAPLSLRIRYPEDQRRERYQFVLRELDLL